eukprot:1088212-Pyramimonas_sp.AAC.1
MVSLRIPLFDPPVGGHARRERTQMYQYPSFPHATSINHLSGLAPARGLEKSRQALGVADIWPLQFCSMRGPQRSGSLP